MDVIADEVNIADEIDKKAKLQRLQVLLQNALDDREKEVILLRYGIGSDKELPQREVARLLGISRSYVSRIETSVLKRLRQML